MIDGNLIAIYIIFAIKQNSTGKRRSSNVATFVIHDYLTLYEE